MITGMAIALKSLDPGIKIFGAEPSRAADAAQVQIFDSLRCNILRESSDCVGHFN